MRPGVKQSDTRAAGFPAETNFLYLPHTGEEHDIGLSGGLPMPPVSREAAARTYVPQTRSPSSAADAVAGSRLVVLRHGCYRTGGSGDFDWGSVPGLQLAR